MPLYTIQDNVDDQYASDVNQLVEGLTGNADIGQLKLLSPLSAPTAPTAAINTNLGNLTGAYKYVVAFVTGYWHGEPVTGTLLVQGNTGYGTESNAINPNGQQGAVSAIPTGPTGTVARILGRTKAGGSTFYKLAQINDNTTTSWTDNTADAGLTVELNQTNTTGSKFVGDGSGLTGITDAVIGNRTGDPALATPASTGTLTQLFGWIMGRIKSITGKTNWYDTPDITLATLNTHKSRHATGGADVLAPSDIGAAAASDFAIHQAEEATQLLRGHMSVPDKIKLDGIATGANAYVHPTNHPASIITQDANNRFTTDAEKAAYAAKAVQGQALTCTQLQSTVLPGGFYNNSGDGILNPDGTLFIGGWWHVQVSYHDPSGFAAQIATSLIDDSQARYYRTSVNTTWNPWRKILDARDYDTLFQYANDGKTAVANAITAKGVSALSTDAFSVLATKIGIISNIKTIQFGFTTMGSAATTFVDISPVDLNKSVVRINTLATNSAANTSLVTGQLANAAQVRLNAGAASTARVYWTVIEYNNAKSVQRGAVSVATADYTGQNVTVSAINPLKSELIVTKRTTDPSVVNAALASYNYSIVNSTTINIVGGDPTYPPVYEWQLVEFN